MLKRFIALIVNSMQSLQSETRDDIRSEAAVAHDERDALMRKLDTLTQEVKRLRRTVART